MENLKYTLKTNRECTYTIIKLWHLSIFYYCYFIYFLPFFPLFQSFRGNPRHISPYISPNISDIFLTYKDFNSLVSDTQSQSVFNFSQMYHKCLCQTSSCGFLLQFSNEHSFLNIANHLFPWWNVYLSA